MLDNRAYIVISFNMMVFDNYISTVRNQVEGGA
jgi:hypothetical protein